jgi:signal transduction histidine kinase
VKYIIIPAILVILCALLTILPDEFIVGLFDYALNIGILSASIYLAIVIGRAEKREESKSFFFALTISLILFSFVLTMSYYYMSLPGSFFRLGSLLENQNLLKLFSYVPLLLIGIRRVGGDSKFIHPKMLVLPSLIVSALLLFQYLMSVEPAGTFQIEYAIFPLLDCLMIFIYLTLLAAYIKTEFIPYWAMIAIAYTLTFFGDFSFVQTEVQNQFSASLSNFFYDLSYIAIFTGLVYILNRDVRLITLEELERERRTFADLYFKAKDLQEILSLINRMLRHDVLNNLQIIMGYIEAFTYTKDEKLLAKAMDAVKKSSEYIDKIRELEKIVTLNEKAVKPVPIREVIEKVASPYKIEIRIMGNCVAMADEAIYSVIDNIINNAIRHGQTDKIDITLAELEDECEIRIADYGIGIPHDIRNEIFREGFRYGSTAGTGLGLYIVRKVVIERYGGKVWIEDNKPKGAIFVIRLKSPKAYSMSGDDERTPLNL